MNIYFFSEVFYIFLPNLFDAVDSSSEFIEQVMLFLKKKKGYRKTS